MTVMRFTPNASPTIGVEIELQLIDSRELGLTSCIDQLMTRIASSYARVGEAGIDAVLCGDQHADLQNGERSGR
jgi:hypothetical protein